MPLEAIEFTPEEQSYFSSRGESEKPGKAEEGRQPPPPGEEPLEALEPATQGQDDDDEDEGPHRSETVPYGRYRKERERRKALIAEVEQSKIKMARFEERLAILNEMMESRGGEQAEVKGKGDAPTKAKSAWEEPNIDPLEDFAGAMDQLTRRQMEQNERDINRQKALESREADTVMSQSYVNDVKAFVGKEPSFAGAYKHLMQTYHEELKAFGMTDVAARNAHILKEEKKLAIWAIENKQSPAQVIFNMALARGFTKPQVESDAGDHGEPEPSKVKNKISTINKGQKSTASLSSGGGGANKPLTADALLNMDDDEFYERVHKAPKHVRRRLLGGE